MLTSPKFVHPQSLVDRLFLRITAIYGSQKTASMWAGLTSSQEQQDAAFAEVKTVWAEALSEFHMDVISAAIRALALSEQMWPPSLPEFVKLCREQEALIAPPVLALPNDASLADPDSPVVVAAREEMRQFIAKHREVA